MNDLDLSVGFDIQDEAAAKKLNETKEKFRSVSVSAEEAAKKVLTNFNPALGLMQQLQDEAKRLKEALLNTGAGADYANLKVNLEEVLRIQKQLNATNTQSKTGFNGLQNSINQLSRELPAFTYSAQTGFMAIANNIPILTDQISQLRAENVRLAASGQNTVPIWKQMLSGLLSWGTAMSVGITLLTVYGKEIGNLIISLFQGAEAFDAAKERIKSLNKALESTDYKNTVSNIKELTINLDLAKSGLISKEGFLKQYNETIGKTTGRVNSLKEAEKELGENADAYVKMMLYKAAAHLALEEAAKKSLEAEQQRLQKDEEFRTGFDKYNDATRTVGTMPGARIDYKKEQAIEAARNKARKDAAIKATEDAATAQENIAKSFQEKAAKISSDPKYKFNFYGDNKDLDKDTKKAEDAFAKALESRKGMLEKIKSLDDEYRIKSYEKDEEERQALKDKFADFRKIIAEENEKIAKYNKENKKQLGLIDAGQIAPIEQRATADLIFKQDTAKLAEELGKQKALFVQYEEFKTKVGAAEADKRFKSDLKNFENYGARLQAEMDKINQTPADKLTGGQKDLLAKLKTDKDAYDRDKKNKDLSQLASDLVDFQSYAEKRLSIQKKYLDKAAALREAGKESEAQEAINKGLEEVTALDESNVQKWGSYKKLFDNINSMSKANTLAAIEEFKKELAAANLTADARAKLQDKLNKLENSVKRGSGRELEKLANDLSQIAGEFASINGNIGNIANVLLTATRSYLEVKKGITDFKEAEGTSEKIGAGLGIVGAGLAVAGSVVNWFKGLKAAEEAAKKAMSEYQQAAIKGELEYQALLRKREQDDIRRGKNSYRAIIDQLELIKKQSPEIQAAFDKVFASLQGQSSVEGVGYKHGTWLRKAKTWDIMASLAGSDYKELEKLYTQGKLKDQAKADFESLKALKEELKAAGVQVEELQQQLSELLTGTTVSGLADGLTQLFENGKFAAEDFGDSFEAIMKNAIVNSFRVKFLQDQMQPFFDELAQLMKAGTPTADQLATLKKKYEALGAQGADAFKQLEAVTGIKLTTPGTADTPSSNSNNVKSGIQAMTEQTANVLSGQFGGFRLAQLDGNSNNKQAFDAIIKSGAEQLFEMRSQTLLQKEIAANTLRTANNTDTLKTGLVDIKDEISGLAKIVSNSKGSALSANGMGG